MTEGPLWLTGVWGMGSANALAVCKGGINHHLSSGVPFVHTRNPDLVWIPVGLVVYHYQKAWPLLWWPLRRLSHCNHLSFLFICPHVFSCFKYIQTIEN